MGHAARAYDLVWEYMEAEDWERFRSLFVAEPEMKFQDGSFRGIEPTLAYFRKVMEMFPDICHEITAVVEEADESRMAGWVTAQATATGSRTLFGNEIDVAGRTLYFEAVDFLFFEDGKISAWWAMLDLESHVRALGVDVEIRPSPLHGVGR